VIVLKDVKIEYLLVETLRKNQPDGKCGSVLESRPLVITGGDGI